MVKLGSELEESGTEEVEVGRERLISVEDKVLDFHCRWERLLKV